MNHRTVHRALFVVWVTLIVPTLTIWRDSVPWLNFMSVYAIVVAHSVGWEAGRAEQAAREDS